MRALSLLLPFASFALLAGLVALEPTTAKVTTGTLEGTVLDSHGKALSGATVTIQTSDGRHPHVTRTDARGHFEFLRFAVGQYDVRAYMNGNHSDWAKRVVIRSMKPNSITLRIPTVEVVTAPNHNWLYLKHLPDDPLTQRYWYPGTAVNVSDAPSRRAGPDRIISPRVGRCERGDDGSEKRSRRTLPTRPSPPVDVTYQTPVGRTGLRIIEVLLISPQQGNQPQQRGRVDAVTREV